MTTLYLCYQSLLEPLTWTQVVAYLEGLSRAGYRTVLLTFEPRRLTAAEVDRWRARLAAKGVIWHWLRYHKCPTVPATAWDVLAGVVTGMRLARRYGARILHARNHVPGLMALALKRLVGAKLLFDLRGFMAEEYVDAGVWPPDRALFRLTKRVERALVRAADAIVVLTHQAKDLVRRWYPKESAGKLIQVIPCCVDLRQWPGPSPAAGPQARAEEKVTVVYVGKLGGWYLVREMAAFVAAAKEMIPGLRWQVWTQSDPRTFRDLLAAQGLNGHVAVGRLPPEALRQELVKAQAGLSLIRPCLSKLSSSPTKVGEYLAAGLPVVSSAGIGDLDGLLLGNGDRGPVGVLVRGFTAEAYREAVPQLLRLLADPATPRRCRRVAEEYFDLERVGWPRYRQVYEHLAGSTPLEPTRSGSAVLAEQRGVVPASESS
jgi:glycosyltransferase involved in cell wall biosynthesis